MRHIIIGSGVAGIAAVEAIRSQDPHAEIVLIGDERHGYYSRPGLAYYLTGELPERNLFPYPAGELDRLRVKRVLAKVTRIDLDAKRIALHQGAAISYDRLLIATGASAARLTNPGCDLEGVLKLDNLDDAQRILKLAHRGRTAVVVGGGITALEIVEALVRHGVRTHYFLRGDRYWGNVLDETESKIIEHRLQEEGVILHYHTELGEILGVRGRVVGVRTKDGRQMKCDLLAVAIGIVPRVQLAADAGIPVERGILVDEYLQTAVPGVYAAGDVAQFYDPLTGKSTLNSLWGPAREQGVIAGMNMVGGLHTYCKLTPVNVTRLANLTTTIIGTVGRGRDDDLLGIARGDSYTWRQLPDAIAAQSGFDVNRLRIMIGKKSILGALIMGDQTLSKALYHLIANQADISDYRTQLLAPDPHLGEIIADLWCCWGGDCASPTRPA